LTVVNALSKELFVFIEALVEAPDNEAGWIGLLPVKREGRLLMPSGVFRGYWMTEE